MLVADGIELAEPLFVGRGEIPLLCRAIDWETTALGGIAGWPASLRTVVRMCLDATTVPMAIWAGPELTLIYNQGYADVLGAPTHPVALGRPAREVWSESWSRLRPQLRRVMEDGECVQFERALLPLSPNAGNERVFVSCSFMPVRDDRGNVVAALNVVHTAQKRVEEAMRAGEEALRASEARLRQLADALPQVVWMARPDGRLDYINERVTEMSGVRRLDDGTWSWADALVPDDRDATIDAWATAVRDGTPFEIAHRLIRTDGTVRWYLTRGVPLRDHDNRIVRWFGTATDIESQKRAEQAVREADRHKTDFLAWVSHELRNPIGIIHTSLALIDRAGLASEPGQRALLVIQRQVRQVDRLLQDLLDIARIAKGKILLRRESVELNEIVRTAGEDHRQMFEDEGIEFDVKITAEPLCGSVDRARIAQAVGNILQNAAKFTSRGGHVVLSLDAAENNAAIIEVRDNGAGVAPEMLAKVFEPLVQDPRTIHRSRGGLGLGLALVKQLAELHGGTASASSGATGGGAVFRVRLPLESHRAVAARHAAPAR